MKRRRFTDELIIGVLHEHRAGGTAKDICRCHGISEQTFYRWKSKYGGMGVSETRCLKVLASETARLKRLRAEAHHSALGYRTLAARLAARAASPELREGSAQPPFRSMTDKGDSQNTWP